MSVNSDAAHMQIAKGRTVDRRARPDPPHRAGSVPPGLLGDPGSAGLAAVKTREEIDRRKDQQHAQAEAEQHVVRIVRADSHRCHGDEQGRGG